MDLGTPISRTGTPVQNDTANVDKKRTKRRKKRSAASSANASGASTPKPSGQETIEFEGLAQDLTIEPGPSKIAPPAEQTFAQGDDFIPFTFDDDEEEEVVEAPVSTSIKGKERARGDHDDSRQRGTHDDRDDDRRMNRRERRDRDRKRSRSRSREREWDRGKRNTYDYGHKAPWIRGLEMDNCKNVAEMMHREVEAFTEWISPSPIEDEIRGLIVRQISAAVTRKFPDASVLPFGSYETKLYLPGGDIDLVIMSDSMAWSDKVTVLHALANTLKRAGITHRVTIIAKARVPIVKFVTTHGRFNVDISINQANGLVSLDIIHGFLRNLHGSSPKTSVALRSLVLVTKAFLADRSMNEVYTGGLGSYSIVCMAVSFLQMHPKIRRGEIDPDKNLGVLVMEFFELYGVCFNYDEVGISVRAGGTYFSKRQRGWYDYMKKGLLSIEDPADPSNDISKGSYGFNKVKAALAGAHSILTSTAYLRAGIINARRTGQSFSLRGRYDPEDLSILSTIMGVTQETLNHRRYVQEIYDRRTLHSLLNIAPSSTVPSSREKEKSNPPPKSKQNPKENGLRPAPAAPKPMQIRGAASQSKPLIEDEEGSASESDGYRGAQERLVSDLKRDYGNELDDEEEEEEGGRYGIGRPPRKRQRAEAHTVFVTDDDDEDDEMLVIPGVEEMNGKKENKWEQERRGSRSKDKDKDWAMEREKQDKKRSYWLSKGIGPGMGDDSFEQHTLHLDSVSYYPQNTNLYDRRRPSYVFSSQFLMSSKPQIPVTNLRERIAALEQRNAANGSRSASPSAALGGAGTVSGLKEKIARFEKKGGVPVPRGAFGLGAPPSAEARATRDPQLYGNRIPQPLRMHHTGGGPPSRSGSSMGFNNSALEGSDGRRSVSMSNAADFDDAPDYTPLTSPTFNHPDSPDENVYTPASTASPTIPEPLQTAVPTKPPIQSRSTSFALAVEVANKAAVGGSKVQDGAMPTPFIASKATVEEPVTNGDSIASTAESNDNSSSGVLSAAPIATDSAGGDNVHNEADMAAAQAIPVEQVISTPQLAGATQTTPSDAPVQIVVSLDGVDVEPVTPTAVATTAATDSISLPEPAIPTVTVEEPTVAPAESAIKAPTRNKQDLSLIPEALVTQSVAPVHEDADDATPTTATFIPPPLPAGISPLSSGSVDSASVRPFSPGELSTVELAWAELGTPATGNVLFFPPTSSNVIRKSSLVSYPLTPEDEAKAAAEDSAEPAFKAVVHEKVTEVAAAAAPSDVAAAPASLKPAGPSGTQTPRKQKRMTMMPGSLQVGLPPPPSPGGHELLSLLENAMMLQSSLEIGELPTDAMKRKAEEEERQAEEAKLAESIAIEKARAQAEEERQAEAAKLANAIANDKARAQAEEEKKLAFQEEPAADKEGDELDEKAKMRHTYLIPLAKAQSQHKKEASLSHKSLPANSAIGGGMRDLLAKPPTPEMPTADLPELPERLPSPGADSPVSPPPPPSPPLIIAPPQPAKSNKSRFSSFRRLTSRKSVIGSQAAVTTNASRKSMARSEMSDETSWSSIVPSVVTPDGNLVHGSVDEYGMVAVGNAHHFPSLSPKKANASRASTFGRMFSSRSRTKSNGSAMSGGSDSGNSKAGSIYTLPPLPDSLSVLHSERQPRKSLSMRSIKSAMKGRTSTDSRIADRPPVPSMPTNSPPAVASEVSSPTSTFGSPLKSPDYIGFGTMDIPSDRRMSMMSVSSLSSILPSPLFDKDIFDSFPAVPSTTGPSIDTTLHSAALMTPSFDSAFLGSASHLSGSNRTTAVQKQPSQGILRNKV